MTVLSVTRDVAEAELDGFRVGHVSGDGMRHQVPLADARAVRFEVMAPCAAVRRAEGSAASAACSPMG